MKKSLSFTQAVSGYLLFAESRHLSQNTLIDYCRTFRKFHTFIEGDPAFEKITVHDIEKFLAAQNVSKKTILNMHIGLSALWTWATQSGAAKVHILHLVKRVKPEKRSIVPFSEDDIRAMLSVISKTRAYTRPGKRESDHSIPTADRNRAIILLLLDTGIRVSELCEARIHHVDVRNKRLTVFGKGSKERTVPFSARTAQTLWRYLATRSKDSTGDYLFSTIFEGPLDRNVIRRGLERIGRRAGVKHVNVHRFRHTFAINYLRNGGDAYSLQMILGHSTLEMVKTYLAIAQTDLERSHKIASPVDHWRL